jgi:outer membrane receptor protein involved in Fe transport
MERKFKGCEYAAISRSVLRDAIRAALHQCGHFSRYTSINTLLLGSLGNYAQSAPATNPAEDTTQSAIPEIVVTAQRRSESIQDVPYNISVVDPGQLTQSGATSLNDLTRVVPGLVTVDTGEGARGRTDNLTLRGLRTDSPGGGQTVAEVPGQSVSPVSTYFGETPVFFPMPLYDVDHVEVLRGPQGTLYGSGSQAGTIRFVPTRPQFDKFSGAVEVTASDTQHASAFNNLNRDVKGVVNLPLADHLALRVVAGREHDGGFIDNVDLFARQPGRGVLATPTPSVPGVLTSGPVIAPEQKNTNTADQWFSRAALRWQPTSAVDLQLDYVHQYINSANAQYSNPGYVGGQLNLTAPNPGPVSAQNPAHWPNSSFNLNPGGTYDSTAFTLSPYTDSIDLYSAVATIDLGLATITSASSYYDDNTYAVADYTPSFFSDAGFNFNTYPPYNFYPRMLAIQQVPANDHAFIQELRLVSSGQNRFDYVIGAFYERQIGTVQFQQFMPGVKDYLSYSGQPNPSAYGDELWHYIRPTQFQDIAGFGELTWHITHDWQVTAGVRVFRQTFDTQSSSSFLLCGALCSADLTSPTGLSTSSSSLKTSRAIKKLNTAYDLTPNLKVYATYSEGFRRGGANALPLAGAYATLPQYQTFSPDFAKNYEAGIKGWILDRRFQYSADIYRINLTNFQFDGENFSYFPATYNGRDARSQGLEFELHAALTRNTQATFGYDYTQAIVTESFQLLDYPTYATIPSLGGNGQPAVLFNGPITTGTKLPGIPLNTFSFALDHTVPLAMLANGSASLKLHVDGAYRSETEATILTATAFNWTIPSNFSGNLRATLDTGGPLTYALFVNNFTDCVCYSGGQNLQAYPNYARDRYVARPRTYGLNLRYSF